MTSLAELSQDDCGPLASLDRPEFAERPLEDPERAWRDEGAVILPGLLDDALVDAYVARYLHDQADPHGYVSPVAYMHVPELRRLCLDRGLGHYLDRLVGETMAVHLNLSGWVSTERNWHADFLLNPPHVGTYYAAAWMTLGDVSEDSGPFEYVPGSHRFPPVVRERILAALEPGERENSDWPRTAERILTPLYEDLIASEGLEVRRFLGKKGDVLLWHSCLLHRGSEPRIAGTPRRALISHYSGVEHREDMPAIAYEGGRPYFVLAG